MQRLSDKPIGMIGLGLLGTALAERLIAGGYRVCVYNRTRDKAAPLLALGAAWSDNPLRECDRVVCCLYTSSIVDSVLTDLQDGFCAGQVVIDTTTGSPAEAAALGHRLESLGVGYLEAPIAASSEQTRRGQAVALVGGPSSTVDDCRDLLDCLTEKYFHVGNWGAASKTKLVNNLILGLTRAALAEGLAFAEAMGLDASTTLSVLKQGNAHSVVMDVKGQKMVDREFHPQGKLAQHSKDVRLILEEAAQAGLRLPLSSLHLELLERAEAAGWGEEDNSAIIRVIAEDPRGGG